MNTEELRELDAWIAEHVMGWQYCKMTGLDPYEDGECWHNEKGKFPCLLPHYTTTDPAAALEVLKRCAEKLGAAPGHSVQIRQREDDFWVVWSDSQGELYVSESNLELAICRFAKTLFGGER